MVKLLTREIKRHILRLDMDALAKLVAQAMGELSFREASAAWGVNSQTLFNIAKGRTRRPSQEVLLAISQGSGVPYDVLALAAYGIIRPPEGAAPVPVLSAPSV
jgi:transcriptional regulator with XRE-family HTH domain